MGICRTFNYSPYAFVLVALFLWGFSLHSQADIGQVNDSEKHTESLELFRQYLKLDTSNPPGGEWLGAKFFADIFEREGIPYELVESAPGRANIRAVIKGREPEALVLLHHLDVVPANINHWQRPPFAALVDDQFIYGRGTVDTKSLGIFHLNTFLTLHRSGKTPDRDVVFMATADEESGSALGLGWLLQHRPEWFENIDVVLNEGATGKSIQGMPTYALEVTQKIPLWLRLQTKGKASHGATPHSKTAVTGLLNAAIKLEKITFIPHAIAPVANYFSALAPFYQSPWRERFSAIETTVKSPEIMAELQVFDYRLYALLTSSCTPTRLQGSNKVNVVPETAFIELDCRLLPDEDPSALITRIKTLFGSTVSVTPLLSFQPGISNVKHPLVSSIRSVLKQYQPGALLIPKMSPGFTDSHFFRARGINAFGFSPIMLGEGFSDGAHGVNEKLRLVDFYQGLDIMENIVFHYLNNKEIK